MTDLEKFIELYRTFGIELEVKKIDDKENHSYFVREEAPTADTKISMSAYDDAFAGYMGFYSEVFFDENGKFLKQGFWE